VLVDYLSARRDQLSEDSLSADPFIEQLRRHTREPLVGKSGGDLLTMNTPTGDHWRRPTSPLGSVGRRLRLAQST
jgi:hypothetical protein